jgi:sulfite reductase (ferredoxin)
LAGTRVEATRQPAMAAAAAGALKVTAVATPSRPPTSYTAKRSAVEIIKQESDFLRHPLMEELVTPEPFINEAAMQLMKFHGSYMQDEREKRAFGKGKSYQFMMRTRQPAGVVSNQLYLAMDDLADKVRRPTLRNESLPHAECIYASHGGSETLTAWRWVDIGCSMATAHCG